MTALVEIFGYLAVLLRGGVLACQTLAVGGVVFIWISRGAVIEAAHRRLVFRAALGLAFFEGLSAAVNAAVIQATVGLPPTEIFAASFMIACVAGSAGALLLAAMARRSRLEGWLPAVPLVLILGSTLATSHAVARLDHPVLMSAATLLHHAATACWIGGIPYLVLALKQSELASVAAVSERFSKLAQISVAGLMVAGFAMYLGYIGSLEALYGTAYGLMVAGKVVLFGCLILLGAFNYFLVKGIRRGDSKILARLRNFGGAEIGIGFTVIFAAASITSQPPAIDLTVDRVTARELLTRMAPQWPPRLETPPIGELSPATPLNPVDAGEYGRLETYVPGAPIYVPSKPGDIAWSEYNHHWAGIIVLAAGLLAALARSGWPGTRWANHWPLVFLGLGVFLLLRADPENWPLGPRGFWESFQVAEVLQHRLFVLLIAVFAFFEWSVRTGRVHMRWAAFVFPAVCALGGGLLLSHSHSVGNIKEEMLQEASHIPLAIFGVVAGWSRWLELKLPAEDRAVPSRIWPVCFVLIGLILLFYREA